MNPAGGDYAIGSEVLVRVVVMGTYGTELMVQIRSITGPTVAPITRALVAGNAVDEAAQ